MSIETIYKIILHPFIQESLTSLKTMTGFDGYADEPFMDSAKHFRFKGYAVCADMTGELNGVVLMHHYPESAIAIGNAVQQSLLGNDGTSTEFTEELVYALREWGNTIVGRATNMLQRHNLGFSFSSPQVALNLDDMSDYLKDVENIVTVPVHVEGVGRYYFNLLIRKVNVTEVSTDFNLEADQYILPPKSGDPLKKDALILLVDDSPVIRKAIRQILNKLDYHNIIEAEDGDIAVEKLETERPDFVFMDVVMDKMNGDQALARMRQLDTTTPIVMLSSVTDETTVKRCQQNGINGFIYKPLNAATGANVLQAYLRV